MRPVPFSDRSKHGIRSALYALTALMATGCGSSPISTTNGFDPYLADGVFGAFEAQTQHCKRDDGSLWGETLCGPMLVADPATRRVWANRNAPHLQPVEGENLWTGSLPAGVPIANSFVRYSDFDWVMVMLPLPRDSQDLGYLVIHESWHRIQEKIGLPSAPYAADHLEDERARYLMRLEFRALAEALVAVGICRTTAVRDALGFRSARLGIYPGARQQERVLDRNEGLASYTGVKLGVADPHEFARQRLIDFDSHNSLTRAYAYASGPAYGLLLDDFRPDWRPALGDAAPADLLASVVAPRHQADLEDASDRYRGQAVRAEESARRQAREAETNRLLAAYAENDRIELPLRQMQFEFDPNLVTTLGAAGTHYGKLIVRDHWGEIRADQGAMINAAFTRLTVLAPNQHESSGPGWTLTLREGFRIVDGPVDGLKVVQESPQDTVPETVLDR